MYRPSEQLGVGSLILTAKEKAYVNQVLDSNRLSYGPFSQKFESDFAACHDSRFGILSNSGTSSLQVALAALKEKYGWEEGDEILVPAITFIATSNVVIMLNLKPVFVDVDPKTYNINPGLIEEKITPKTKAIIPVHMFGLPADMDTIMAVAQKHKLRVLEDSCETMFVGINGKPVGSFGDIGCFSTYVAHFLVTGVGGLSVTNDPELAVMMRSLVNHGRDGIYLSIDDDENKHGDELAMVVKKRFNFVRLGYSYRVTEMEAALGLAQLEMKDEILAARQTNAKMLIDFLAPLEKEGYIQLPSTPDYAEHSFMLFPIVVADPAIERDSLILFLEEHLIETRPMMPLLNQPFYVKEFGNLEPQYPVASGLNRTGFYVGCHQGFDEQKLRYIADTFASFFDQNSKRRPVVKS